MANYRRILPHVSSKYVDKYKIVYLPLPAYGFVSTALASDAADQAEGALIHSAGALGSDGAGATAIISELSSQKVTGYRFREVGDDVGLIWPCPYDLDVKNAIDFAVVWSSDQTTTTDTLTWKVLYTKLTMNTTAITAGGTALSTAIAADANIGTANAIQQSPWGILNGSTLTDNDSALSLLVELDATSGAAPATDILMGYYLAIRYVRRIL